MPATDQACRRSLVYLLGVGGASAFLRRVEIFVVLPIVSVYYYPEEMRSFGRGYPMTSTPLSTTHLSRTIKTLEVSFQMLQSAQAGSIEYEVARNATIKGFELCLETAGKLLRKSLKPYFASSRQVDELMFKDLFRHAHKHGFFTADEVDRWFSYRDNRNKTAHDYGEGFAEETVKLIQPFLQDAIKLKGVIDVRSAST
jgi:nucleotidyltransferase substrate binding protein (TIGR01987 family)